MPITNKNVEITKPSASVDGMVKRGVMAIMLRRGGMAKRLEIKTESKIRALAKAGKGNEVILNTRSGSGIVYI